jgi:hypothetical protein
VQARRETARGVDEFEGQCRLEIGTALRTNTATASSTTEHLAE